MIFTPVLHRSLLGLSTLALTAVLAPLASAQSPTGLIGARYVQASFLYEDVDQAGVDDGLGLTVRANIPLHAAIDLTISGTHEEIDTASFREQNAFAMLVAHWDARDITPFLTVGAGNIWQSVTIAGEKIREDEAVFAVGAGFEAPIADRTALDLRVLYHKYSDGDLDAYWIYGASINHWFSDSLAGIASLQFRESDSIIVSIGAAFRF